MRTLSLAILVLCLALAGLSGCTRATGGGEARYLALFSGVWQRCHDLGLYEVRVESVTKLANGYKRVAVRYVYDNGEVPDQGHAAMLVSPEGRLASRCVVDLGINECLCGEARDWHEGP